MKIENVMRVFRPDLTSIGWVSKDNILSEKEQCLLSMLEMLVENNIVTDKNLLFSKILDREHAMSTGIGNRIAIPHVRDSSISSFKAVIYLLDKEIDFASIDGRKVKLVILFVIPEKESTNYMRLLGKVSELLREEEIRSLVFNCRNKNKLYTIFRRLEDELQSES